MDPEIDRIIHVLESKDCPQSIISRLESWNNESSERFIDKAQLENWCQSAGITDKKKIEKIAGAGKHA